MRILVVEDNRRIADLMMRALEAEGYSCQHALDGEQGLALALNGDFDAVLLDLMLPKKPGVDVCQELRLANNFTPIIMVTALGSREDVIAGLRMGADDYINKPFDIDVLLARLEAVTRRSQGEKAATSLVLGPLQLSAKTLEATLNGQPLTLTAKELALLELFIAEAGTLLSRERILSNIWGIDSDPLTNVVDVYIAKLRKKFSAAGGGVAITTQRGVGYKLIEQS